MRAIIQRVKKAAVEIEGKTHAETGKGLLIFIAFTHHDADSEIEKFVHKILQLRIFPGEKGLMNLSVKEVNGEILIISQFTLYANTHKGNRPSFFDAAKPQTAMPLYEKFISTMQSNYPDKIKCGVFGADMKVHLINDGPVTIILEN
jgi:D-tyrosyl-tRNA(Tyr) deacylase